MASRCWSIHVLIASLSGRMVGCLGVYLSAGLYELGEAFGGGKVCAVQMMDIAKKRSSKLLSSLKVPYVMVFDVSRDI
jgi:hypothetical protein